MDTKRFRITLSSSDLVPESKGRKYYGLALILLVIMLPLIAGASAYLPAKVPLYFSLPWGEARLVNKSFLYGLPMLGLVFVQINLIISRAVREEEILTMTLAVGTALVASMLMISLLGILQAVL